MREYYQDPTNSAIIN